MLSPQRIRLTLAMLLAMATLIALGLSLDVGQTAPAKPLKAKLLRRANDHSKPNAAEKDYLRKYASGQEEKKEEREFENQIPQHLPIKVKLRAEKEKAAKDMSSNRWHRDLELEVKNTGDKPIYYLSLIIEIPEATIGGNPVSVHMRYGEHSVLGESKGIATPDDIPFNPKETLILRLDEKQARAWEGWKRRLEWSQPKRVLIIFEDLSFGDGTGFFGGNGAPWPFPKHRPTESLNHSRTIVPAIRTHHVTTVDTRIVAALIGGESATVWPASFRLEGSLDLPITYPDGEADPPDYCCPRGCRLVNVYNAKFCYYCPELSHADGVACMYEFDGICGTVEYKQQLCDDGIYCPYQNTYPCGYVPPSPSPTPSPTPTPTPPPCDPATKPNNTNCLCDTIPYIIAGAPPQWSCSCSGGTGADYHQYPGTSGYQGCPPNKYNNGNNCCICIIQFCPDGSSVDPSSCECPTPTPGGGGGSGDSPPPEPCTPYWWVYYESYDGGQTWHEIDRWYAGCW